MVQSFLDIVEKCWLLFDQNVEQKITFRHTMDASYLQAIMPQNMGKLPDNLPIIPMLCYYLQRVPRQLLVYVTLATKETGVMAQ